jgi:hypothetical protein
MYRWIYIINHNWGFALVNQYSQVDGVMRDAVVNDAGGLGDTVSGANPQTFDQ